MESPSTAPLATAAYPTSSSSWARDVPQGPTLVEAITARAYETFVGRGGTHGHHQDDWTAATWDVIADTLG